MSRILSRSGQDFFDKSILIGYGGNILCSTAATSYQPPVPQTIGRRLSSPKTAVRFGIM